MLTRFGREYRTTDIVQLAKKCRLCTLTTTPVCVQRKVVQQAHMKPLCSPHATLFCGYRHYWDSRQQNMYWAEYHDSAISYQGISLTDKVLVWHSAICKDCTSFNPSSPRSRLHRFADPLSGSPHSCSLLLIPTRLLHLRPNTSIAGLVGLIHPLFCVISTFFSYHAPDHNHKGAVQTDH